MSRIAHDAYYTPDSVARALVGVLPNLAGSLVLEPHVGGGAFARTLLSRGARVAAMDMDPEAAGLGLDGLYAAGIGDFCGIGALRHICDYPELPDWVVGNPPYSDAEAHVRRALDVAPRVAFLLRLAFLESAGRAPLWMAHPPAVVHVLSERPSFGFGGKTDSCAYGWFIWLPRSEWPAQETALRWLSWRGAR